MTQLLCAFPDIFKRNAFLAGAHGRMDIYRKPGGEMLLQSCFKAFFKAAGNKNMFVGIFFGNAPPCAARGRLIYLKSVQINLMPQGCEKRKIGVNAGALKQIAKTNQIDSEFFIAELAGQGKRAVSPCKMLR